MNVLVPVAWLLAVLPVAALGGIQPEGTRVIYPAAKKEVTLNITNQADAPRLIQAWMDNGDPELRPGTDTVPFIVHPPIFRLDPGKGHTLRIHHTGGMLPGDRESVFWLNILEIGSRPTGEDAATRNIMQFPVRSRLKVFYRPQGLPGSPEQAVSQLRWRLTPDGIECSNPGAFHVSFNRVALKGSPDNGDTPHGMCPAKGKTTFVLTPRPARSGGTLALSTITDHGGYRDSEAVYTDQ